MQAAEATDSVVDVNHEVAGIQSLQLAQREAAVGLATLARGGPVITAEDLVVGVDHQAGLAGRQLESFV
jgi:hypothetical protein